MVGGQDFTEVALKVRLLCQPPVSGEVCFAFGWVLRVLAVVQRLSPAMLVHDMHMVLLVHLQGFHIFGQIDPPPLRRCHNLILLVAGPALH